jgi:hypothetical protein
MARKAPIISLNEFELKMSKYIKSYNDPDCGNDEEFPYNLPSIVLDSDLTKIEFDFENYCIGDANPDCNEQEYTDYYDYTNYPCGYKILPSGIPVLLVNAGGDWEFPICFALYFDGKSIRGYIPTEGNVFDKKNKSAYGNHDDCPEDEELLKLIDSVSIINDINTRIQTK